MRLKNQISLVTGGCRGIGRQITLQLAAKGSFVAIGYKNNVAQACELADEIKRQNGVAIPVRIDNEDKTSIEQGLTKVNHEFGQVSILVNNGAIAQEKPFHSISEDDWDKMMAINLKGPFILSQAVLPHMKEAKWGRIVNIVSIGGQWGGINQVHYAVSKAGLIGLTKSLAKIYSSFGITVNAVSPGLVATDMASNELQTEEGKKKVVNIPIGRIATKDEIANVVAFLCTKEASYITGQTINLNGGMYFG